MFAGASLDENSGAFCELKANFFRLILTKAEVLVFIGIIMEYFNHSLLEIVFPVLGNSVTLVCFILLMLYKKKH